MSVLIKNMEMPKGCIYANDNDQTEYCPLLNHDDVPFCQYIENEPESAIGIDERPVYCPLSDVSEPCQDTVSRQDAIDALADMHCKSDEDGYVWIIRSDAWARIDALPSVQPTLCGYDIKHLMLIAEALKKENLPPERVTDALTDIERIINIVRDEFEETLWESIKHFKN